MSSTLSLYRSAAGCTAVRLPFAVADVVDGWAALRPIMARRMPDAFTRDEWAYLISFLDPTNLLSPFEQSLGEPTADGADRVVRLMRPRGSVGVWLPGNVSLLGPLTMILVSLTGNRIRLKGASGTEDLTGVFLEFARQSLPDGPLRDYLRDSVSHDVFDRTDARNQEMAAEVNARIVFGSDEAVRAVHSLDHPMDSVGISFADRQSEAWIDRDALSERLLTDLIKVFAVYGQAGCTSPRRVVLLGATEVGAGEVRDRVQAMWTSVIRGDPAPHVASENVMSRQCAAARGWDAVLAPRNAAVLASGTTALEMFPGQMALAFVPATIEKAVDTLPAQIQTIGYGFSKPLDEAWLDLLGRTGVKRMVPIARMHHFGPVWDGQPFWRQLFEEVEVG